MHRNEKTELISYFVFPAERLHRSGVHFCPDISFAQRDGQIIELLRTCILQRLKFVP